jgi:hypothetical protein
LNDTRLRAAVESNLGAQGLQAAAGTTADCTVSYAIGSRLAVDPATPRFSWGFGMGFGHRGFGSAVGVSSSPSYDYREGRIAVNLFNARTNEPVWHASVDLDVTELTGADAQRKINAAVAAIFAKFPTAVAPRN